MNPPDEDEEEHNNEEEEEEDEEEEDGEEEDEAEDEDNNEEEEDNDDENEEMEEEEDEDNNEEEEDDDDENEEIEKEELINPSPSSQSRSAETTQLSDEATSSITTRFRGVMPDKKRSDCHWGANIHADNDCIFLGVFSSEIKAARAYDSASMKFLGTNFFRNFLLTNVTIYEPEFQTMFTKDDILDMLRDGVYETKFIEFVRNLLSIPDDCDSIHLPDEFNALDNICIREMFHKVLTSSDVDNQGILTLPREPAMQHFPQLKPNSIELPLEFTTLIRRTWVFQYSYSQRAQSYVFTTGWNKFVTEMNLRADDSVVFYRCMELENSIRKHFYVIDMRFSVKRDLEAMVEYSMEIGVDINRSSGSCEKEGNSKELMDVNGNEEKKPIRLLECGLGEERLYNR